MTVGIFRSRIFAAGRAFLRDGAASPRLRRLLLFR